MYTFKQIKDYLKAQPEIKFEGIERDQYKLSEFLEKLLTFNNSFNTLYLNNKIQTERKKRRSIGDLYRIVRYYYPNVKIVTVYRALLKQISEGKAISSICIATSMRVYRSTTNGEKSYLNGERVDEFGVDLKQFEEESKCQMLDGYWGDNYTKENLKLIEIK